MKNKALEGIESLLFALGAGLGYFLANQNYSWWIVLSSILVIGVIMEKLVGFLREINKKKA